MSQPAAPPPRALAFPTRTALPERQPPADPSHVYGLSEVRWCEFNKVRVVAALDAATASQRPAVLATSRAWDALCDHYLNRRADEERVAGEVERFRARLEGEGRAMLDGRTP